MALSQHSAGTTTLLEFPSLSERSSMTPFYSSTSLSCSTSDLNNIDNSEPLSPRFLYAQSFHRPQSSRSLPSTRFRKNMKEMTGFRTTEEEFEALPIAVRRKVRRESPISNSSEKSSTGPILVVASVREARVGTSKGSSNSPTSRLSRRSKTFPSSLTSLHFICTTKKSLVTDSCFNYCRNEEPESHFSLNC